MIRNSIVMTLTVALLAVLAASNAAALPKRGDKAETFPPVRDIRGQEVNLDKILKAAPDMVILFLFSTKGGEEVPKRLGALDELYGRSKIKIIAFGIKEQEDALKKFADALRIEYYVLPDNAVNADALYGPIEELPLTYILSSDRTIVSIIRGGGESSARLLTKVAENYLMQGKGEDARAVADQGIKAGEDKQAASTIKGFAAVQEGKLDEADAEFKQIDAKEGLAAVALERGDAEQAIALADQAPDSGYADTVKAKALMRTGKLDEAGKVLEGAEKKPAMDFQKAETLVGKGRLQQEKGELDQAVGDYEQALNLNPYHVTALSNEGAAYRQKGDLNKATEVLDKAQKLGGDNPDPLVGMMLRQIQDEMKKAADAQRGELIRKQIEDLGKRYKEQQAAGTDKPVDDWSTRPLVVAFLPSENKGPVFFERAGTDVALRHEIESQLQQHPRVQVVEREMLDKLLQELNLGSSDLTSPDTQLKLGKVLSAQLLGFVDYAQAGPDTALYLRLVNSETTAIDTVLVRNLKGAQKLDELIKGMVDELTTKIFTEHKLKGLIAQVDGDTVLINLGAKHGLEVGEKLAVLQEGEPIEVGGKKLPSKMTKVATLEVTEVQDELSTCKVVEKKDTAILTKEMKVLELAKTSAP